MKAETLPNPDRLQTAFANFAPIAQQNFFSFQRRALTFV
jgi:hypothetical protein